MAFTNFPYLTALIALACFFPTSYSFVTQTIYGFLDFTTTIADTVMVFSPHSAPLLDVEEHNRISGGAIKTDPNVMESQSFISPTRKSFFDESLQITTVAKQEPFFRGISSVSVENTSTKSFSFLGSNYQQPGYDFLSRQPVEFVEENFRVISHEKKPQENRSTKASNLLHLFPSTSNLKQHSNESKTFSGIHFEKHGHGNFKKISKTHIRPSSTLHVLKTDQASRNSSGLSALNTSGKSSSLSNRINKNPNSSPISSNIVEIRPTLSSSQRTSSKKPRPRNKTKRRNKSTNRKATSFGVDATGHRTLRLKVEASAASSTESRSLSNSMLKLNRTPGRWQYRTTPKPRISIRKIFNESTTVTDSSPLLKVVTEIGQDNTKIFYGGEEIQSAGSQNDPNSNNVYDYKNDITFVETLNVDISTPGDFKSVYYEIATIKTPYVFQVGLLTKTRFITVTSVYEKTISEDSSLYLGENEPLIENIYTSSFEPKHILMESSIVYLNPVYLENNVKTPVLQSNIETYSTTLTKHKTQVLPFVLYGTNETSYTTFTQSYSITTIIAATRTFLALEESDILSSKHFKDISFSLDEAGSEMNLELEFGDTDNLEVLHNKKNLVGLSLNPTKNDTQEGVSYPNLFTTENPRPGLSTPNIYVPMQKLSTVITNTYPVVIPETIWTSHVVSVVNGMSTVYRTLSKSLGTVDKTQYRLEKATILLPDILPSAISTNPFLLKQEYRPVTSAILQETTIPQTKSKVLKLTFGAKTAYTTIYSTFDVQTTLTTFVTTSVPVLTSALSGYFAPQIQQLPLFQ